MTVTLPADLESGRYYITPWTDPYQFVAEDTLAININPDDPDEIDNNNYKARAIDVIALQEDLPDLVVDWVAVTPETQGGEEITITYSVRNVGTAEAAWWHPYGSVGDPGPFYWLDEIRLVSDLGEQPEKDLFLSNVLVIAQSGFNSAMARLMAGTAGIDLETGVEDGTVIVLDEPLGPGESYTHSITIPLNPSAEGAHALVAADARRWTSGAFGYIEEIDENNNRGDGDTLVTPVPADLVVTAATVEPIDAAQVYSGDSVRVRYTVTNVGDYPVWPGTDYWKESLWLSADVLDEWVVYGFNPSAYRATYLGENIHFQNEPLQPGESYDVECDLMLPAGLDGDYFVYIQLSSLGGDKQLYPDWWLVDRSHNLSWLTFFESTAFEYPYNNLHRVELPVTYREPDLVVTTFDTPSTATSGEVIQVSYEVANLGTRATRVNSWWDGIILSHDAFLDEGDVLLSSFRVVRQEPLAPGNSYTQTVEIQLPESVEGDFHILVFADSAVKSGSLFYTPSSISDRLPGINFALPSSVLGGASRERLAMARGLVWEFEDEGNNLVAAPLQVSLDPPPDLQVTSLSVPEHVVRGQKFEVTWTVSNLGGDTPADQRVWDDLVYLSRDEVLDLKADRYMASLPHSGELGADASYSRTVYITAPKDLLGPYYVFVVADPVRYLPGGRVFEGSNEYNNDRASDVPVIIELPPPADLEVTQIDVAGTATSGQAVPISWTVINTAAEPASGTWSDCVYLSADGIWDIRDKLIGRVAYSGTLAQGQSYTSMLTEPLPTVLPGNYRIIVRADIYNQIYEGDGEVGNVAVSTELVEVTVDELAIGVPLQTILNAGDERLFQVTVPQNKTLAVTLGSPYELALHEVFVRHGAVPSSAAYDAVSAGGMDQIVTAVVPSTEPGVYYVLLRGHNEPAGGGVVTVLAELVPLVITDVHTDAGGDSRYVTTTIRGAQFHQQAIVKLVRPGFGEYEPVDYQVVDSTKIVATFDFTDAVHGLYDVKVINPGGDQAVVPYRFLLERAIEPEVTIGLGGPRIVDAGDVGRFSVALVNTGNIDAPYVFFEVGIPDMGINQRVYNLPYVQFSTNLRGNPETTATQDVPWASLDPAVKTSLTAGKAGYWLAPGYLLDEHAEGFTGFTFDVATYPLLNELLSYDWDRIKGMAYTLFPELAETDALAAGPESLDAIAPGLYAEYLAQTLMSDPCYRSQYAAFQFPIVAAATTMTRDEFVDHAVAEAMRLREAILEDTEAASALLSIAADEATWQQLYLASLEEAGILRPEDETPPARENPRLLSLMATLSAGILIGPAGSDIRTSGDIGNFFEQIRQWYGHEPESVVELQDVATCGAKCGNQAARLTFPTEWPERSDYDLGLEHATHFEAFRVYVPWGSIGHPKGLADPGALTDYLSLPGEESELVSLQGPFAFDTNGYVPAEESLPFTVYFQTDPGASTYAHEIRLVTPLDDELSARSFRLGDLKIGDISVHVPEGRNVFQNDFDFTDAKGFLLRVSAAIEPESRQATWLLQAIDPLTGELLEDPNNGLLPPNDAAGSGSGFVSYTAVLSNDAQSGDRLSAQARVMMDNAPPEDTATLSYLVDAHAPVTTLSVSSMSGTKPTYSVTWKVVDEQNGSGVRHVTLYVATDGGDFKIWQRQRPEATGSEVFVGEAGHVYEFLALATDVAGNRERPAFRGNVPDDGTTTNLGGNPLVAETTPENFGVAPHPSPEPSTNPLFHEVEKLVPSALSDVRPTEFTEVLRPLVARAFATGMEQSHADIGPLAIVEAPDGSILVSGGASRNEIYRFDVTGGETGEPLAELDYPVFNMAFDAEGRLWATTGGGPLLELDPETCEILHQYADGITIALAVEPGSGLIYVSSSSGVEVFDPDTETFTHYSRDRDIRVGSLAFDAAAALWATTWPDRERVVRFNDRARAETMLLFDADVDSIAFGQSGTALEGLLFVSHVEGPQIAAGSAARAGSELTLVDLATLRQLPVARGGTRGDVVMTTSDGRILVSQSNQIDILYPSFAQL